MAEMTSVSEPALVGRRVLVADDQAALRWVHVGRLRDAGARVTEARDGFEALRLARAEQPDLILADTSLPRLDGLELCEALRQDPSIEAIPVVLLSDGEPPQAVWTGSGQSPWMVDAVLEVLERHLEPSVDPIERENVRAQSAVSMHRDPANHVSHALDVVWRMRTSTMPHADGSVSGFGAELQVMSRIFGAGLVALIVATVGLITWSLAMPAVRSTAPVAVVEGPGSAEEPSSPTVSLAAPGRAPPPRQERARREGLTAFSGVLRPGVDVLTVAAAGQGGLVLDGQAEIHASIDGVERGALPVSVILDEGRHVVRYRLGERISDRFYYVKAGSTRVLRAITRPGGFVDAR